MSNPTPCALSLQLPLFDFHEISLSPYSEREVEFANCLSSLKSLLLPEERIYLFSEPRTGRKGYTGFQILSVLLLKIYRRCSTVREVISILRNEPNYRFITELTSVPSEASLSRRTRELAGRIDVMGIHERLASGFFGGRQSCNLSVDSTPVDAYERPVRKERKAKRKRGRKRKGSQEEAEHLRRKAEEKELRELRNTGDVRSYLGTLESRCTVTGKRNSKGNMAWRIGYKLHLAVDDNGIPVSYAVTGASVHDSRVAIPLLRMAAERCSYRYALMDAGYASAEIHDAVTRLGAVPIIDGKAKRNGEKEEMEPALRERYRARTTVERSNSEVKGCFLPDHLCSRGCKARLDIELAVLLLSMKRMRMVERKEEELRARKAS